MTKMWAEVGDAPVEFSDVNVGGQPVQRHILLHEREQLTVDN